MAKKKFNIQAIMMATGGGLATNTLMNIAEKNIKVLQKNPILTPLMPVIVGTLGVHFTTDKYSPFFYGMLGAAGGDLVDSITSMISQKKMDGLSRVNYKIDGLSRVNYKIDGVDNLKDNPLMSWTDNMVKGEGELSSRELEEDFNYVELDDE